MRKIISKLYIILLMFAGCVSIQDENSAGTTATGNNGVIVGDIEQNKYVKRLIADGDISSEDVVVHLYTKDDPYTVQRSTQLNEYNQFRFEQLDHAIYAVRVDVGEDKGGLKENIIIANSEAVYITIEINIYTTNIINNFYFSDEKADVKNLASSYGSTQLTTNSDGSFTIKTIGGTSDTLILVTQSSDSLELYVRVKEGIVVVTPISEELEISKPSALLSSSSAILASSSNVVEFDSLKMRFNNSNAKDTWNTDGFRFADHNGGGSKIARMAKYDNSTQSRTLLQIEVPVILNDKDISNAEIELTVCEIANKLGGQKNTIIHTHKILKSWDEGNGTTSNGQANSSITKKGVSATNRRPGEPWVEFSIGLNDKDASSKIYSANELSWLNASSLNLGRKFSVDVTDVIKEWIESPSNNFGLLLKAANENEDNLTLPNMYFACTKEADSLLDRPLLKVIYKRSL